MVCNMFFLVLLVSFATAHAQDCKCFTSSAVNIRDAPCGNIIGSGSSGQCFPSSGGSQSCDLSGTTIEFVEFEYNDGSGWAASDYLADGNCPPAEPGVCGNVRVVDRAGWSARDPEYVIDGLPSTPVSNVFIHHTVTSTCFTEADCIVQVQGVQNIHLDAHGWPDIGYNFLVGGDGQAYEGRGWNKVGDHTYGCNSNAVAVAMIGNFHPPDDGTDPNDAILEAAKNIIDCAINEGVVVGWDAGLRIFGHRDFTRSPGCNALACPGDSVYTVIEKWPWYSTDDPGCTCQQRT